MVKALEKSRPDLAFNFETSSLIRGLDLIASGLGLILLTPIFLIIGWVIELTSAGSMFYKAKRVGQDGQFFQLYKFRTMYLGADQQGAGITVKDDPRITPVGRFLRRTKLDELPQLINVFRGEMSLVGPRPEDPRYVALYTPEQRQVLTVRPGLTSPASLYYRTEETLLEGDNWETIYRDRILPHKLALDLAYLQHRTVWTDLLLILETIVTVVISKSYLNSVLEARNRHFFLLDILALLLIPAIALTLRLGRLDWWSQNGQALLFFTTVALLVKIPIFYNLGLYRRYWRYTGVSDLTQVLIAIGLSMTILMFVFTGAHSVLARHGLAMYRTVPLIDGLLTVLSVGGFRLGLRGLYHWHRQRQKVIGGRRVLVVGAGEAGTMAVREMRANPQLNMEPLVFVDDDPAKIGTHIAGLPVLGTSEDIPDLVDQYQIQQIIVAVPSAPLDCQRKIISRCQQTGVATDSLPGVYELLAGSKTISHLPKIDMDRLLDREPVTIDQAEVVACLGGAKVLVTGAGGSIGSELCRQVAELGPKEMILLGHGENSIFEISLDLRLSFPDLPIHQAIIDVRDQKQINRVVKEYRPDIIFHAAAHKHVPFMEASAEEAITNNVLGTQNVLQAAQQYGVDRFVLISTDKAINPISIMGATKRIAELLVITAAQRTGRAYVAVRFGNVLGSRGSVIPVFQRQIAANGPLTITHPDMRRYFMTIPEAVQLVLQAMVLGQGGEVFVLDMGKPVRILDLATNLIKLSGLEPGRDIAIAHTGIRPGEKLNEELFLESENYRCTKHEKIFVARSENRINAEALEQAVAKLIHLARQVQTQAAIKQIQIILPEYKPQSLPAQPVVTSRISSPTSSMS